MTNPSGQQPVFLFDGVCVFCNFWASFVLRHDRDHQFRLGHLQSESGRRILDRVGIVPGSIDSVVLVEDDKAYIRSDAIFRILARLPPPWRWLRIFRVLPASLRDGCYDLIGRWRYRIFGRYEACPAVSKAHRNRFID